MKATVFLALALPFAVILAVVQAQTIPSVYDPRGSTCAPPVLNQGQCGSCYAFSTATTLAGTMCSSTGDTNWLGASPQFALDANFMAQSQSIDPCNGGWASSLMSVIQTSYPSAVGLCQSGCTTGCLPYTESSCNPPPSTDTTAQALAYMENNCDGSCTCSSFTNTGCSASGSSPYPVPSNVQFGAPTILSTSTVASVATAVQQWLLNNGPVSVAMDACDDFQNYFNGDARCPEGGMYYTTSSDWMGALGCSSGGVCISTDAISGWTALSTSTANYYATCVSGSVVPFPGSCTGQDDHAVTIVGWTQLNGQSVWIVQNSWGTTGGDGGYFYIPINPVNSVGDVSLSNPVGFTVSPASKRSVEDVAATTAAPSAKSVSTQTLPTAKPGSHYPMDITTLEAQRVVNSYLTLANTARNDVHTVVQPATVTRQVTNTIVYSITVQLTQASTGTTHVHTAVLSRAYSPLPAPGSPLSVTPGRTPFLGATELHLARYTVSTALPNPGLPLGLGLGLGLGLAVVASVAVGVMCYVRRRAQVPTASPTLLTEVKQVVV